MREIRRCRENWANLRGVPRPGMILRGREWLEQCQKVGCSDCSHDSAMIMALRCCCCQFHEQRATLLKRGFALIEFRHCSNTPMTCEDVTAVSDQRRN
eukprot:14465257-Ditylum_brightwellii.AAC.1